MKPSKPTKRTRKSNGDQKRRPLTPALVSRICKQVALGKSLRKVLKGSGMPSMSHFMERMQEDRDAAEQYARARERGIGVHIDDILDLADSATPENAHVVRLRVDTRKWLASKLVPKVYGDRVDLRGELEVKREPPSMLETARRLGAILAYAHEEADRRSLAGFLPAPAEQGQKATTLGESAPSAESTKQTTERQSENAPRRPPITIDIETVLRKQNDLADEDADGMRSVNAEEAEIRRGSPERRFPVVVTGSRKPWTGRR